MMLLTAAVERSPMWGAESPKRDLHPAQTSEPHPALGPLCKGSPTAFVANGKLLEMPFLFLQGSHSLLIHSGQF